MHLTEKGELWTMLDKMERKRIPKPEHLDLLRRPMNRLNDIGNNFDLANDDDDDEELGHVKTATSMFSSAAAMNSPNRGSRHLYDDNDDDDEIAVEGASVHNHDAGRLDKMERYATLLRTERIDEWKKHQKFLRAQAQAALERKKREDERLAEEDRLMQEFLAKEMAAREKEAEEKFVVDLL